MASPQKENGFTPIANEILEKILEVKLNATQLKILILLWRFTYGFSRKEHELSETFISRAIGTDRIYTHKELSKLIKMNIVLVKRHPSYSQARSISFNKNYEEWSIERQQVSKKTTGVQKDSETGVEKYSKTGVGFDTQDNKKAKRNSKPKNSYAENVFLTEDQFKSIAEKYGTKGRDRIIELLSTYKLSSGKKYKDDFAAMRNWVFARYEKEVNFDSAETKRPEPLEMSEDDYEIQVIKC